MELYNILKLLAKPILIIFISGTIIQVLALLVLHSNIFPTLESRLLKRYCKMRDALNRLENRDVITTNDSGFIEIAEFIIGDLKKNEPEALDNLSLHEKLQTLKATDIVSLSFSGIPKSYPGMQVGYLSNRIHVSCSSNLADHFTIYEYKLEQEIENQRQRSLFWYAVGFFALGTSVQLVNVIIEIFKKNN